VNNLGGELQPSTSIVCDLTRERFVLEASQTHFPNKFSQMLVPAMTSFTLNRITQGLRFKYLLLKLVVGSQIWHQLSRLVGRRSGYH